MRWSLRSIAVVALLVGLLGFLAYTARDGRPMARVEGWVAGAGEPIRVGLLHSTSGPSAVSEKSLIDAAVLALEEINAAGGLLERRVEWVVVDGKSDARAYAAGARQLLEESKVAAIFGGWSSESRLAIRSVVEERGGILFYPNTFEGFEPSGRVVYAGGSSNQTAVPAIRWCVDAKKARRFFVAGAEEIWSRSTAEILKDAVKAAGGEVVGEAYLPAAGGETGPIVAAIRAARPDFVLDAIPGTPNEAFFRDLAKAGLTPDSCPVMAFAFGEDELRRFSPAEVAGHYAAMNYFQSIDRAENREFVSRFRARFGADRAAGDPIVASYNAVKLWAQAVTEAGTVDPTTVLQHLERQSIDAPDGIVTIDADLHIAWRPFYLGRARPDGQFDVVWSVLKPVRPVLFVATRPNRAWMDFYRALKARLGH